MAVTPEPVLPLRLRRALLLLHVGFWLAFGGFLFTPIFGWIYEGVREAPDWLVSFWIGGIIVGRVTFYVSLWRLVRGLGKRPIIWVGACLLFWPLADLMVYPSLATQPKEWAARPDAATGTP
jgi:hypothetical protein